LNKKPKLLIYLNARTAFLRVGGTAGTNIPTTFGVGYD